jgi:hypothetical protein
MIVRPARIAVVALAAACLSVSCANPFAPQYEYEEQVYLEVDGAASVVIDTSFAALVALRGGAIDPAIASAADRDAVRTFVTAAGCRVDNVSRFWTRHGRRFVQIQVSAAHLKDLPSCKLLSWSGYSLEKFKTDGLLFEQQVGPPAPAGAGQSSAQVNWAGNELVAFKAHLPSRILDHNVKLLDGTNGGPERGNILTWAQTLKDRQAGKPLAMRVEMDGKSILHTTLWLFAGAFAAAVALLVLIIWLVIRKGRKAAAARRF